MTLNKHRFPPHVHQGAPTELRSMNQTVPLLVYHAYCVYTANIKYRDYRRYVKNVRPPVIK